LFDVLRRNRKDVQNFNHYLDNDVGHSVCWRHFRVGFEPFEEVLDPIEQIGKGFFTCRDVLGSLTDIDVENVPKRGLGRSSPRRESRYQQRSHLQVRISVKAIRDRS
jgi:hypothetical protein